jgi:hypothetical protein
MANVNTNALIDAALDIAQERRDILTELRAALETGDHLRALSLARKLCGLEDEQERNRTHPRVN